MGGAQPLAVTMNGGVVICVDVRPGQHRRRIEHGYLDVEADDTDDALRRGAAPPRPSAAAVDRPARQRRRGGARDAGDAARRSTSSPTRRRRTTRSPTCRAASRSRTWPRCAREDPAGVHRAGARVDGRARRGDGRLHGRRGRGVRLRQLDPRRGRAGAATSGRSTFPGFVPAYIRPLFCEGKGPFRWAALSGDPADIAATDRAILDLFPDNEPLASWIEMAGGEGPLPGPARPDLLARLRRAGQGRPALQRPGGQRARSARRS